MNDGFYGTSSADLTEALTASWYRSLELASPLPLVEGEVVPVLEEIARYALNALEDGHKARNLFAKGRAMADLGDFPFTTATALQRAWAEVIADTLAVDEERLVLAFEVGARLTLGFLEGLSLKRKQANVQATRRMGHDLKTPLNAVTGFSRVILKGIDGPITDFQREDLSSIYQAGQDLLAMIEAIVEVAKRDAEAAVIEVSTIDIPLLVGNVTATVQPLLAKRNNRLVVRLAGNLGRIHAPLMEVRWMALAPALLFNRLVADGEIVLEVVRRNGEEGALLWNYITEAVDAETIEQVAEHDVGMMTLRRFARELGCIVAFAQIDGQSLCSLEMPFPPVGEGSEEVRNAA